MQRTEPDVISVVYSGDTDATKEQIITKVKARFDITLAPDTLTLQDRAWPRFTLLGQSLGSMYLAWEAMSKFVPDLYIDTMGYAFTFHIVAWLAGIPVGAYVHYPTISTDMLARVEARRTTYANSDAISSSTLLSRGKLMYYRLFMYHYALALRSSSFLMVNSSWTKNHVDAILAHSDPLLDFIHLPLTFIGSLALSIVHALARAAIVYPPCNTLALSQFPLDGRPSLLLSLAQFRPEKDHAAQIRMMAALLQRYPEHRQVVRLLLAGGVRNEGDSARYEHRIHVEFVVNAPYPRILELLGHASVGLNTMAAGVIPVVHASGGPLRDIVVPVDGLRTGFHAKDPESFAQAVHEVMMMSEEERRSIRARARQWATTTFSQDAFEKGWTQSGWSRWL
ncbi:mannosyltransferase [Lactarius sanguifluus]|nr:mannosyltransferase [Lactarius sanguifluus]